MEGFLSLEHLKYHFNRNLEYLTLLLFGLAAFAYLKMNKGGEPLEIVRLKKEAKTQLQLLGAFTPLNDEAFLRLFRVVLKCQLHCNLDQGRRSAVERSGPFGASNWPAYEKLIDDLEADKIVLTDQILTELLASIAVEKTVYYKALFRAKQTALNKIWTALFKEMQEDLPNITAEQAHSGYKWLILRECEVEDKMRPIIFN